MKTITEKIMDSVVEETAINESYFERMIYRIRFQRAGSREQTIIPVYCFRHELENLADILSHGAFLRGGRSHEYAAETGPFYGHPDALPKNTKGDK